MGSTITLAQMEDEERKRKNEVSALKKFVNWYKKRSIE